MANLPGSRRFAESTRGQILERLRCGACTVDELARELALTDNAVRAHLATLERDGMIRAAGTRHDGGVGKPAVLYEASLEADAALSRAYVPLLRALLGALGTRLTPARLRTLFRDAGRRLAAGRGIADGTLRERAQRAADVLNDLGGSATVVPSGSGYRIVGCGCPASAAVADQPGVCVAVEAMLHDVTGAVVRRECEHHPRPQCRFEVTAAR
ncbi:MAG TPA: helix-turn-helix domain-containing protein [Gemmatimonadaceae bacterium]|nr:helix-turn-helix domain-containing protein [Gemmatimonadaceae bacterium]